jgi:hypothetical protein
MARISADYFHRLIFIREHLRSSADILAEPKPGYNPRNPRHSFALPSKAGIKSAVDDLLFEESRWRETDNRLRFAST